jgi:hypothetical protein
VFTFLKSRRKLREARTKIGVDLHRQVRIAFMTDDKVASERLATSFTVGYVYSFIRNGFYSLGVDADSSIETQVRRVCDGILPGKLYNIFSSQREALNFARGMKDQDSEILNTGRTPSDVAVMFVHGCNAGVYDAPLVSTQIAPPDNLRRFLLNENLRS